VQRFSAIKVTRRDFVASACVPLPLHLLKHQYGTALQSMSGAFIDGRRERQRVTIELVKPHLLGSCATLIPREIDVVDDLIAICGISCRRV
jgi:hypothetical protein